jgi:hypothetical protein
LKTGQNWQSLNCKEQLILFVDTLLEKSKTYFQFFPRYGNRLRKTAFAIIGGRNPGDQRHQQAPPAGIAAARPILARLLTLLVHQSASQLP